MPPRPIPTGRGRPTTRAVLAALVAFGALAAVPVAVPAAGAQDGTVPAPTAPPATTAPVAPPTSSAPPPPVPPPPPPTTAPDPAAEAAEAAEEAAELERQRQAEQEEQERQEREAAELERQRRAERREQEREQKALDRQERRAARAEREAEERRAAEEEFAHRAALAEEEALRREQEHQAAVEEYVRRAEIAERERAEALERARQEAAERRRRQLELKAARMQAYTDSLRAAAEERRATEPWAALADLPQSSDCHTITGNRIPRLVADIFRCRLREAGFSEAEVWWVTAEALVVARCESGFDPDIVVFHGLYTTRAHPLTRSRYTAAGVFQFIRPTADRWIDGGYDNVFDPVANIDAAARLYLHNRRRGTDGWDDWACAAVNDGFAEASVLPTWPGGPDELPQWAFEH